MGAAAWGEGMNPEYDYKFTNKWKFGAVEQRTRIIPVQEYATELFIQPFMADDFDPSKLSDRELLMLSQLKAAATDVHYQPVKVIEMPDGTFKTQKGAIMEQRPGKEVEHYELVPVATGSKPLLELLSPENYEKALQEAEKRGGGVPIMWQNQS